MLCVLQEVPIIMLEKKQRFIRDLKLLSLNIAGTFYENKKKLMFLSIGMIIVIIYNIISTEQTLFREMNIVFSIADSFVQMTYMYYKCVYIGPLFLWMLMYLLKGDSLLQFVVRSRSRITVWKWDCCKIILASLYVSILQTLTIAGIGLTRGQPLINWTEKKSVFRAQTGVILYTEESLLHIIIIFNVTTVITCILIGLMYMTVKEFATNTIVAFIICLSWCLIEYYTTGFVLRNLCMQYKFWTHKEYNWNGMMMVIIVLFILAILSRKLVVRREYY